MIKKATAQLAVALDYYFKNTLEFNILFWVLLVFGRMVFFLVYFKNVLIFKDIKLLFFRRYFNI